MSKQTYRDPDTGKIFDDMGVHIKSLEDYQSGVNSGQYKSAVDFSKAPWYNAMIKASNRNTDNSSGNNIPDINIDTGGGKASDSSSNNGDTIGDIYGDLLPNETPEEKAARLERERQGNLFKQDANSVVDEESIRQATLKRFQAEIDSLNQIYADKLREEKIRGQGRLGTDAAIQSRRGMLGSTFGSAQTDRVEDANKAAEDVVNEEKAYAISQVMAKVRKDVSDEVEAKRQARREGADKYLAFLEGQAERSKKRIEDTITNLLSIDGEVDDKTYEDLAEALGTTPENLKRLYGDAIAANEAANSAAQLDRLQTLKPGETIVDPANGNAIYTAPEKPETTNPMDYVKVIDKNLLQYDPSTNTWNVIYSAPDDGSGDFDTVRINGVDYIVNSNGDLEEPKVPAKPADPAQIEALQDKITLIDDLLKGDGLGSVTGTTPFGRFPIWDKLSGESQRFIGGLKQLISKETMDVLVNLKAAGGTLGALSDQERIMLQNAASKIGGWEIKKDGQGTGKYDVSEEDMRKELKRIQDLAQKALERANGSVDYGGDGNFDDLDAALDELGFSKVGGDTKKIAEAIGQYESGGNYNAKGPIVVSGMYKGDRAYGKYQVMGKNIPSWSKEALGRSITKEEFLANPELQDKIAQYKMNKIYQQYGNVEDVASVWFSGQPVARAGNRKDVLGTTVPQYVKNVSAIYNRLG